jgi:poly-gamma-glutamate synthesis protein (capsule biosynthesis protein)
MKKNEIKLLFTGDLAPINSAESKQNKEYQIIIDEKINQLFQSHDLRICNLESPLTNSSDKIRKTGPHLKADPFSIKLVNDLDIDVTCLSNNHIRDYGEQGIRDTLEICQSNGLFF